MASSLDQLRKLTTVVADTGDFAGEKLLVQVSYLYGRGKRGVCVEGGVLNNYRDSNLIRRRISR